MEQKIEKNIAENLLALRKNRGLKQSELSDEIGYSDKTISRWENGTSTPDIATLVQLSKFYGITIEDLITEDAVIKAAKENSKKKHERMISDGAMISLAAITIWVLASLIYVGLVIFQQMNMWQVFLWAIPLSSIVAYRTTRRNPSYKWLNFTLLSFIILSTVAATYFQCVEFGYDFWQIFLLAIPLESMVIVSTLFIKKDFEDKRKALKAQKKEAKELEKTTVNKEVATTDTTIDE